MRRTLLPTQEPQWVRRTLIGIAAFFLAFMVLLPVAAIFTYALSRGLAVYRDALVDAETLAALRLSLLVTAIVVPLNLLFGLAASWALGKFNFIGRQLLIVLIDLPLSVSPVIAGLIYVLLFSLQAPLGQWLSDYNIQIIFATPGIVIATIFVTFPYVARELIPLIQQQGNEEEEAALLLGSRGLSTYLRVTLPNIKWGVLYGTLLCCARALGEFGAVSVVSGHIQGLTNTLPLQIEILYNEYNFTAAFAASSLLAILALVTLVLKALIEWRSGRQHHPPN